MTRHDTAWTCRFKYGHSYGGYKTNASLNLWRRGRTMRPGGARRAPRDGIPAPGRALPRLPGLHGSADCTLNRSARSRGLAEPCGCSATRIPQPDPSGTTGLVSRRAERPRVVQCGARLLAIFTQNATAALKHVGESYSFAAGGRSASPRTTTLGERDPRVRTAKGEGRLVRA